MLRKQRSLGIGPWRYELARLIISNCSGLSNDKRVNFWLEQPAANKEPAPNNAFRRVITVMGASSFFWWRV
ncbi:MAG: hypothetical protein CMK09_11765 [Ponticaulis sp.]|nr:hypothetical protein [Ponticaulis sp.]